MKKRKILIIISSILIILAIAAWLNFKVQSPKSKSNALLHDTSSMKDMDMESMNEGETKQKAIHSEKDIYTCSMHTQIIREEPGKCPICGMQLLKKETQGAVIHDVSLHTLLQPANSYSISAIPAITITKSTEAIEINAVGFTSYNTNEMGTIAARFSGRIEKLYVGYRFQKINKGQRIMDLYSPELLTDQQNLLFLLKNDPSNMSLIVSAKQRLLLLGFPQGGIEQIIKSGKPLLTIPVYSNYSGHIHEALETGMNNIVSTTKVMNEAPTLITQELSLKEGMYIQKGQTVFKVYDPKKLWALLNIYPSDQPFIKLGNVVTIEPEGRPGKKIKGTIYFIEPFFREGNKTVTARVNINNSEFELPVGIQLKATIFAKEINADWLPRDAVVSLGFEKIVFVKTGNAFKAQKIETGVEHLDLIQIKGGLSSTDSVAAKAQYLIDSESFIKVNN